MAGADSTGPDMTETTVLNFDTQLILKKCPPVKTDLT